MPEPAGQGSFENASKTEAAPAAAEATGADIGLGANPEISVDAPTIISKSIGASRRADKNFTDMLRGRRLAHFELEEPVGVGGMAAVISARDLQLDRKVALKILPPEMASEPENIKRFQQEARAAAKLDHENIARAFYCGEDQGLHFIAFEFVEGQNLRALMEQRGAIPVAESIHYMLQIAAGLAHAIARGVVHRDIKPSNIIVDEDGRAKLVDMGLARSLETHAEQGLTQSGVTLGTFDYISPEQALEPREADARSDIYSLGCTFYHLLTGQPPVPEGTAARKLQFHQQGAPIDPRQLRPEIPTEVAAILGRMIAKDPKDRYQSFEELGKHLMTVSQQMASPAMPSSRAEIVFADPILPPPPRSHPLAVMAMAGAAVAVLVVLVGLLSNPEPDPGVRSQGSAIRGQESGAGGQEGIAQTPIRAETPVESPAESAHRNVHTVQRLRESVQSRPTGCIFLDAGKTYDLGIANSNQEQALGLVFSQGELTIAAAQGSGADRPVILLSNSEAGSSGDEMAAITVKGGKLTLRGLRVEIDGSRGSAPLSALCVRAGHLVLEDCEFYQRQPDGSAVRLTVLKVPRSSAASPTIEIEARGCYFAGGQDGFTVEEASQIEVQDCVFAPYQHALQITRKDASSTPVLLRLRQSSWLVASGSRHVIFVDSRPLSIFEVNQCIFSQPEAGATEAAARATLLHVSPERSFENCRWSGQGNCFHNFAGLVSHAVDETGFPGGAESPRRQKLRADIRQTGVSLTADVRPWAKQHPVTELSGPRSFRLNAAVPELQLSERMLGARHVLGEDLYPQLERDLADAKAALSPPSQGGPAVTRSPVKDLIVDRDGPYKSIASALGAAESDDVVITIKSNGVLLEMPLEIRKKKKVTIRAAEGFHPVLALDPQYVPGSDGEAALFRIHDEELILENLEFRVQPLKENTRLESLVTITGAGRCRMEHCVATLEAGEGSRIVLLSLSDPTGAMMGTGNKPARTGVPSLEISNTFVRGQGDLLTVRASRPFQLDLKNTLVALGGSLVSIEGNKLGNPISGGASVSLQRVTAYLTQHVLVQRCTTAMPVHVPVDLFSSGCILASAEGKALFYFEGPEGEDELKRRLSWHGERNLYSTNGSLLVTHPLATMAMSNRYDPTRWQSLWGQDDDQPRFARVRFSGLSSGGAALGQTSPDDFKVVPGETEDGDPDGLGVDLDKLSKPTAEETSQ